MELLFVKFCSTGHRGLSLELIQDIQILEVLKILGNNSGIYCRSSLCMKTVSASSKVD